MTSWKRTLVIGLVGAPIGVASAQESCGNLVDDDGDCGGQARGGRVNRGAAVRDRADHAFRGHRRNRIDGRRPGDRVPRDQAPRAVDGLGRESGGLPQGGQRDERWRDADLVDRRCDRSDGRGIGLAGGREDGGQQVEQRSGAAQVRGGAGHRAISGRPGGDHAANVVAPCRGVEGGRATTRVGDGRAGVVQRALEQCADTVEQCRHAGQVGGLHRGHAQTGSQGHTSCERSSA